MIQHFTSADVSEMGQKNAHALDNLGIKSAEAQGLRSPITSVELIKQCDQDILLYLSKQPETQNQILGFIKFGKKNLYFYNVKGQIMQRDCICVLDFYVSEPQQRHGIGQQLFQEMLEVCDIPPDEFAYDRPSPKLIAFLKKYHQLADPNFQPNRYMIFPSLLK